MAMDAIGADFGGETDVASPAALHMVGQTT